MSDVAKIKSPFYFPNVFSILLMPKFHKAKETDSIFCDGLLLDSKETDTSYRKLTVTFSG